MKAYLASLFTLFFMFAAFAQEIPNPGPRSPDEAQFLFAQAEEEIAHQNLDGAIRNLERFTQRYSLDPKYSRALEMLITLQLAKGNAQTAASLSKTYLLGDSKSETAQTIRLRLVEAYGVQNKMALARTAAKDLLAGNISNGTKSRALFLLARIDSKEKKWADARAKLDALPAPIPATDRDSLLLEIGVAECSDAKKPSAKIKQDDPWIEYYEKQNDCMKALAAAQTQAQSFLAHPSWCKQFKTLTTSLASSHINAYQKKRLQDEYKKTADIARKLTCE